MFGEHFNGSIDIRFGICNFCFISSVETKEGDC